jgi:hypothetical protein
MLEGYDWNFDPFYNEPARSDKEWVKKKCGILSAECGICQLTISD